MCSHVRLLSAVIVSIIALGLVTAQEQFAEEAFVSFLPDGLTLVHIQFSSRTPIQRHSTYFPSAIKQLATAIPFKRVELSLTQGRWHYDNWGAPSVAVKPAGAELQATFSPQLPSSRLPELWGNTSHALGGLFCASLNFVARPETTAAQAITMHQQEPGTMYASWVPVAAKAHVLYAALPQEASCTENLTPWLKLLPCRDQAGLGHLLVRRDIVFGADYHSLQVTLQVTRGPNLQPTYLHLTQSLTVVLRSLQEKETAGSSRANPAAASVVDLAQLLGSQWRGPCPVAQHSRVYLKLSQQQMQSTQHLVQQKANKEDSTPVSEKLAGATAIGSPSENSASSNNDSSRGSALQYATNTPAAQLHQGASNSVLVHDQDDSILPTAVLMGSTHLCPASQPPEGFARQQQQQAGNCRLQGLCMFDMLQHKLSAGLGMKLVYGTNNNTTGQGPKQRAAGVPEACAARPATAAGTQQPFLTATRYLTGTGQLHGGMVLQLQLLPYAGYAAAEGADGAQGHSPICITQVVPWYIRLWLHTLQLAIDGKPESLGKSLLLRHISPAQDRAKPLVLSLCLKIPASAQTVTLSAQYTKAFLTAFEHPPDAHRGFDVPAAIITSGGPIIGQQGVQASATAPGAGAPAGLDSMKQTGQSNSTASSSSSWCVAALSVDDQQHLDVQTPLLASLAEPRPHMVYSPGLVVPLAVPDFSMPYNVICLTSTVLAVFFGATLNSLLERPGDTLRQAQANLSAAVRRRKKLKLVLVVLVCGGFGVYLDPSLQDTIVHQLQGLGFVQRPSSS